jgi:DNA (cytosine-5)-methyltransferase 1
MIGQRRDDYDFLRTTVRPPYERGEEQITMVDLFSGCGGMALGVAHAAHLKGYSVHIPLAIDNDRRAVAVFQDNFPDAGCVPDDVCDWFAPAFDARLTTAEREARARAGTGVDFLVGGPPCQGNSNLNNHTRRNDPRNALYSRMARAARVLEPRIVVIENVPRVVNDYGGVVEATREALEREGEALGREGYRVAYSTLKLCHMGLPQLRERHILIAIRDGEYSPEAILETLREDHGHGIRDLEWAIVDLVDIPAESGFDLASNPSQDNAERIRYLFAHDEYELPNHWRPPCHQNDSHTYTSIYGRLRWNQPAQTITTGFNSMGQGRNVHPARPRTITPHEAARLQFLPDFFSFEAVNTRGAWAQLIGNAVPPLLTMQIAEHTLDDAPAREDVVADLQSRQHLVETR